MGLYSGGLTCIIGRIFASEILGAYFREGLFIYLFFVAGVGGGGAYYQNFTVLWFLLPRLLNFVIILQEPLYNCSYHIKMSQIQSSVSMPYFTISYFSKHLT